MLNCCKKKKKSAGDKIKVIRFIKATKARKKKIILIKIKRTFISDVTSTLLTTKLKKTKQTNKGETGLAYEI